MPGGSLPPVFVELRAKINEFQAAMGEAKTEITKLEQHGAGTADKLGALGKGLAIGLGGVAIGVGAFALENADKYEKAHARMVAATQAAGQNVGDFQKQINEVQKRLEGYGFTHAQVQDAVARGVVSSQDLGKSLNAAGLAADIARARGVDLATAYDIIDKAQTGNLRGLKQMGIDLPIVASNAEKVQKAQEALAKAHEQVALASEVHGKTSAQAQQAVIAHQMAILNITAAEKKLSDDRAAGKPPAQIARDTELVSIAHERLAAMTDQAAKVSPNLASALDRVKAAQATLNAEQTASGSIMDALTQRFGGQAQMQAETFAGKIDALKARAQDMGVALGMWLIPKIEALANVIAQAVDWLGKHLSAMAPVAAFIIGPLAVAFGVWAVGAAVAAFNTFMLLLPIILVFAAIGTLSAAVVYAYQHWGTFRDVVNAVKDFIINQALPAIQTFAETVGRVFVTAFEIVRSVVTTVWNLVRPILDSMKQAINDILGPLGKVADIVGGVGGAIGGAIGGLFGGGGGSKPAPKPAPPAPQVNVNVQTGASPGEIGSVVAWNLNALNMVP